MKQRSWDEFTEGASEWSPQLSRRDFLELAGASLALAGLVGCTRPPRDPIYPYVIRPEDSIPGRPDFFATGRVLGGLATGLLVETHQGRPTKIEGNPDHPASLGSASAWQQASILGLYDPDRGQQVTRQKNPSSWTDFQKAWKQIEAQLLTETGKGMVLLTELSTSPTLKSQIQALKEKFPSLSWIQYEPLFRTASQQAAKDVFGSELSPVYDFERAQVVISLDSDFLSSAGEPVSYAKHFMRRRRQSDHDGQAPNQLFVAECALSLTGLKADHRIALQSNELKKLAFQLAEGLRHPTANPSSKWLREVLTLIPQHRGRCLFIAGAQQPREVHLICHLLNSEYGTGVVRYIPSPLQGAQTELQSLLSDLEKKKVSALFIFGANPVYSSPLGSTLAQHIKEVPFSARLGLYDDETASACQWYLPQSDDFEGWSDSMSFDGSTLVIQPVVRPLYDTRNAHEVLAYLSDHQEVSSYQIIRQNWQKILGSDFEKKWKSSLQKGMILPPSPSLPSLKVQLSAVKTLETSHADEPPALEVTFRPDLCVWDGRFANNAWLQELPDPLTKITWENVVAVSAQWAQARKISPGQVLDIQIGDRKVRAPAWILEGLPEKTLVLTTGYGRDRLGKVGQGIGYNAFAVMAPDRQDFTPAQVTITPEIATLACAQTHQKMEGRDFVKTTADLPSRKPETSLYPENPLENPMDDQAWAMSIDLDSCIGCAACVIACQSENNIPVVGKKGVLLGREMHWIRIDRYQDGNFQPVPCMHCEKAPCEEVCPVAATAHGNGGLNQMIYNRCVGTRYCSSNCPYKVRRFNFLDFTRFSEVEKLQKNPDVSIRPRGVMEKCTYCVQRINQARIQAKLGNRKVRDGEIQTACQQTCPTEAIVFGDLKDPQSRVRALRDSPRRYSLLEELGTRPRTTYLARVARGAEANSNG